MNQNYTGFCFFQHNRVSCINDQTEKTYLHFRTHIQQENKRTKKHNCEALSIHEISQTFLPVVPLHIMHLVNTKTTGQKIKSTLQDDFFFLISNFKFINKAQRGATLIHGKYTRAPLKGRNR